MPALLPPDLEGDEGTPRRLAGTNVLLVSISVDPEHDTPAVLSDYAERFGALPDRWWFLTGPKSTIYDLVQNRFKLSLVEGRARRSGDRRRGDRPQRPPRPGGPGPSRRLLRFERPEDVEILVARARRRALPRWVRILPTVNASLNALSAALLLAGWIMIRRYRLATGQTGRSADSADFGPSIWDQPLVKAHIACMVSAVGTSTLFLVCYLVYHYYAGSYPFPQGGFLRVVYLSILLSHTLLATASVPLIVITVLRGWRGDLAGHTRFATITFPIWMYVAVTGVVIYLMLYHLPILSSVSGTPS